MAFDERQYSNDLFICQDILKCRHITLVAWNIAKAIFDRINQLSISVMPSVTAIIVRRCQKAPIWFLAAPVGLTLQLGPVTARTMHGIYLFTLGHEFGILGIKAGTCNIRLDRPEYRQAKE